MIQVKPPVAKEGEQKRRSLNRLSLPSIHLKPDTAGLSLSLE
jgi:hypothetical protein